VKEADSQIFEASMLALQGLLQRKLLGQLGLDVLETEAGLLRLHLIQSLLVLRFRDVDLCRVRCLDFFPKVPDEIESLKVDVWRKTYNESQC
jgi:hypothetical protein